MSGRKLRVIVQISAHAEQGLTRLAIPVPLTETIAQLESEIVRRSNLDEEHASRLKLYLIDGSLLFSEDTI
ncbi:hypothetical protein OBBRIDRAFT_690431, partial [Obba rivulosa]